MLSNTDTKKFKDEEGLVKKAKNALQYYYDVIIDNPETLDISRSEHDVSPIDLYLSDLLLSISSVERSEFEWLLKELNSYEIELLTNFFIQYSSSDSDRLSLWLILTEIKNCLHENLSLSVDEIDQYLNSATIILEEQNRFVDLIELFSLTQNYSMLIKECYGVTLSPIRLGDEGNRISLYTKYHLILIILQTLKARFGIKDLTEYLETFSINLIHKFSFKLLNDQLQHFKSGEIYSKKAILLYASEDYNDGINIQIDVKEIEKLIGETPLIMEIHSPLEKIRDLISKMKNLELVVIDSHGNRERLYVNGDLLLDSSKIFELIGSAFPTGDKELEVAILSCQGEPINDSTLQDKINLICRYLKFPFRFFGASVDGTLNSLERSSNGELIVNFLPSSSREN